MDAISRCRNTVQKKGLWWNWKKECVARQRYVYIIIKYAANRDAMQNTLDTNQEIVCLLIELFHEQRLLQVVPLYCFAPCFFSFAQQYSFHTLFILLWNCIIFSTKLHEAVVLFLALDSHCRCKKKKKKFTYFFYTVLPSQLPVFFYWAVSNVTGRGANKAPRPALRLIVLPGPWFTRGWQT